MLKKHAMKKKMRPVPVNEVIFKVMWLHYTYHNSILDVLAELVHTFFFPPLQHARYVPISAHLIIHYYLRNCLNWTSHQPCTSQLVYFLNSNPLIWSVLCSLCWNPSSFATDFSFLIPIISLTVLSCYIIYCT